MPKITRKNASQASVEVAVAESKDNRELESRLEGELYTVKLDNKRFEQRTLEQAISLVKGSASSVGKITIEPILVYKD